jgi:ABC-type glycerol-3-phosphate transport system permease component
MLDVVMSSVIVLRAIMLIVIILIVVMPFYWVTSMTFNTDQWPVLQNYYDRHLTIVSDARKWRQYHKCNWRC